jgi:hypothetical protein
MRLYNECLVLHVRLHEVAHVVASQFVSLIHLILSLLAHEVFQTRDVAEAGVSCK